MCITQRGHAYVRASCRTLERAANIDACWCCELLLVHTLLTVRTRGRCSRADVATRHPRMTVPRLFRSMTSPLAPPLRHPFEVVLQALQTPELHRARKTVHELLGV